MKEKLLKNLVDLAVSKAPDAVADKIIETGGLAQPARHALMAFFAREVSAGRMEAELYQGLAAHFTQETVSGRLDAALRKQLTTYFAAEIAAGRADATSRKLLETYFTDQIVNGQLDESLRARLEAYFTDEIVNRQLDAPLRARLEAYFTDEIISGRLDAALRGRLAAYFTDEIMNGQLDAALRARLEAYFTDEIVAGRLDATLRARLTKSFSEELTSAAASPDIQNTLLSRLASNDAHAVALAAVKADAPQAVEALIESKKLYKAERERLTEAIAEHPVSEKQTEIYRKVLDYLEAFDNLYRWADQTYAGMQDKKLDGLVRVLEQQAEIRDVLLDMVCEGNLCHLNGAVMEFLDREQLWVMFEEILFAEEYFIQFDTDEPMILDCGTNIGLAIYYAKHRYPKARIIGFEPWSTAWECAMRNVQRNGWQDVIIHHAALGKQEGEMELIIMEENSLASTLTNRMDQDIVQRQMTAYNETVPVIRLSPFLDGPVDFLKMDIEGVEEQVLKECSERLGQVGWIFVEYHYASQLKENDLSAIMALLAQNAFDMNVSLSISFAKRSKRRPFNSVGKKTSMLIWGKRHE